MSKFLPLGLAILLLLINIVSFSFTSTNKSIVEESYQTRSLLLDSEKLISRLKDMQSAQRGFILTEDEKFLELYYATEPEIDVLTRRLDGYKLEHERVVEINNQASLTKEFFKKMVTLGKERKFSEAEKAIEDGEGKRRMDKARVLVEDLQNQVNKVRDKQYGALANNYSWSTVLLFLNGIMTLVLSGLFFLRMSQKLYHTEQ